MVSGPVLSQKLIQMIERVSEAENIQLAGQVLLTTLLEIFRMDIAVLFEKSGETFKANIAVDRTNRILPPGQDLMQSNTVLSQALLSMEPMAKTYSQSNDAPLSIKRGQVQHAVSLPLNRATGTVLYLASKSLPEREYSDDDLVQFKTAAKASWLALNNFRTVATLQSTKAELQSLRSHKPSLIYTSPVMQGLEEDIARISPFNISVLIAGESGAGKEVVARRIHELSGRPGTFVAVNCANLSENLLESELFGFVKGAFTGAQGSKPGLMKVADGGSLFLDEIAELPYSLQAKLLRAIQEKVIRPVGGTEDLPVDVRLITATHRDLENLVGDGKFRSDLLYRIQEFKILVPALRERKDDIEILAQYFISEASREMRLGDRKLSAPALKKLVGHSWPGNVRELKSVCRTAMILCRENEIQDADIRFQFREATSSSSTPAQQPNASNNGELPDIAKLLRQPGSLRDLRRDVEKLLIQRMLDTGLTQAQAADRLGISVRTLQRVLSGLSEVNSDAVLESFPV